MRIRITPTILPRQWRKLKAGFLSSRHNLSLSQKGSFHWWEPWSCICFCLAPPDLFCSRVRRFVLLAPRRICRIWNPTRCWELANLPSCKKEAWNLRFFVSRSFQILILWRLQQQQQQGEAVEDSWTWNVPLNWKFVFTLGVHFTVLWQALPCYKL